MNPDFEAAIRSSLGGHALTPAEMAMLSNHLPVDNPEGEVYQVSDSVDFATRILQRKQNIFIRNTDMLYCLEISKLNCFCM